MSDLLALALIAEVVLVLPAAAYVVVVYWRARARSPREDVPPLYTMVALLCVAVAVGGSAMVALLLYFWDRGEFPFRGNLLAIVIGVQLLVPMAVAEFIRRIRRTSGPPPADPPGGTA